MVAILETMMVGVFRMIWSNIRALNLLGLVLNMIGTLLIIIGSSDRINPWFMNRDGQIDQLITPYSNKWSAKRLKAAKFWPSVLLIGFMVQFYAVYIDP
jgi:hypothetical protein